MPDGISWYACDQWLTPLTSLIKKLMHSLKGLYMLHTSANLLNKCVRWTRPSAYEYLANMRQELVDANS